MKIKYNIPMFNEIKECIKNIGNKINKNQRKVPMKYYMLLALMFVVGVITFSTNVNRYNNITSEKYTKYELNDGVKVDSDKVDKVQNTEPGSKIYSTAISSISTNVANIVDSDGENNPIIKNYIWPVSGKVIKEHAIDELVYSKTLDMWRIHPGIDILAELGDDVVAIKDGKVISTRIDSFYGNVVEVEHSNGYVSRYSNLDGFYNLNEGDNVKQGEVIGHIGVSSYGEIEDDVHLHFEILKDNEWINPIDILE